MLNCRGIDINIIKVQVQMAMGAIYARKVVPPVVAVIEPHEAQDN